MLTRADALCIGFKSKNIRQVPQSLHCKQIGFAYGNEPFRNLKLFANETGLRPWPSAQEDADLQRRRSREKEQTWASNL